MNVLVEEKRTGSFNFGAGFSSIDNLLGFAEITQGNFDITRWPYFTGGGQKFRLRVQYGTRRKDFVLSLTEPYFLDREIAVGGELFYREASFTSSVYDERRYGFDAHGAQAARPVPLRARRLHAGGHRPSSTWTTDASQTIQARSRAAALEERGFRRPDLRHPRLRSSSPAAASASTSRRLRARAASSAATRTSTASISKASKYFLLPWDTILTLNGEVAAVEHLGGRRPRADL